MDPAWTAGMLRETVRAWFRRAHAVRAKVDVLLSAVAKDGDSLFRGSGACAGGGLPAPSFATDMQYDDSDWTEEAALVLASKEKRAAEAREARARRTAAVLAASEAATSAGVGAGVDAGAGAGAGSGAGSSGNGDRGPASAARRRAAENTEALFRAAEETAAAQAIAAVLEVEGIGGDGGGGGGGGDGGGNGDGSNGDGNGDGGDAKKRGPGRPRGPRGMRELLVLNAEKERLGSVVASERRTRTQAGVADGRSAADFSRDYGGPSYTRRSVPATGPWSNVSSEDRRRAEELGIKAPPSDDVLVAYVLDKVEWKVRRARCCACDRPRRSSLLLSPTHTETPPPPRLTGTISRPNLRRKSVDRRGVCHHEAEFQRGRRGRRRRARVVGNAPRALVVRARGFACRARPRCRSGRGRAEWARCEPARARALG
jgi:hypothetical protein